MSQSKPKNVGIACATCEKPVAPRAFTPIPDGYCMCHKYAAPRPKKFMGSEAGRKILGASPKINATISGLRDSGERRDFETGAQRDRAAGKGRYDLLSPIALRRVAIIHEKGALKYKDSPGGERNWELGMPLSCFLDSAMRHLQKLMDGMDDEDHAAMVAWNLHSFMHIDERIATGQLPSNLDDLPHEKNLEYS